MPTKITTAHGIAEAIGLFTEIDGIDYRITLIT
jgi:hypothetical protein